MTTSTLQRAHLTQAEAAVLEALLPDGLTEGMRDIVWCLFEAPVLEDARLGAPVSGDWAQQLQAWARHALLQLRHMQAEIGGREFYLARGVAVALSARDRAICAEFRGDYTALARKHGLTEMRIRQIVGAWQREQFARRQAGLPGID